MSVRVWRARGGAPCPVARGFAGSIPRTVTLLACALILVAPACECDRKAGGAAASASATSEPGALDPELAGRVLARVGDRTITVGDYAAVLERMDEFERLRYQTEDRRKLLLDEMIDLELLAREAERRGLADRPETEELIRQALRDELLREVRAAVPPLEAIPAAEVRAYYDAHRGEFKEPERRRIAHIVMKNEQRARAVLEQAREATPEGWGRLVQQHSLDRPAAQGGVPPVPVELRGDLGMVTPPDHPENDNPKVPAAVRAAAFRIEKLGGVHPELVPDGGRFHIVRLMGKSAARDRSLEEAERTIRVRILREKIRQAEAELEAELRKKFPVTIDEEALARVKVPGEEGLDPATQGPTAKP